MASGAWDATKAGASAVGGAASGAYDKYQQMTDTKPVAAGDAKIDWTGKTPISWTQALGAGVDWMEKKAGEGLDAGAKSAEGIPVLEQLAGAGAFVGKGMTNLTGGVIRGAGDIVGGIENVFAHPIDSAAGIEGILEHNSTIPFMGSTLKAIHGAYDIATDKKNAEYGNSWGDLANHVFNPMQQMKDDQAFDSNLARGIVAPGTKDWGDAWNHIKQNPADAFGRAVTNIAPMVMGLGEAAGGEEAGQASKGLAEPTPKPPSGPLPERLPLPEPAPTPVEIPKPIEPLPSPGEPPPSSAPRSSPPSTPEPPGSGPPTKRYPVGPSGEPEPPVPGWNDPPSSRPPSSGEPPSSGSPRASGEPPTSSKPSTSGESPASGGPEGGSKGTKGQLDQRLQNMLDNDIDPQQHLGYSSEEWNQLQKDAASNPDKALKDLDARMDRHGVRAETSAGPASEPEPQLKVPEVPDNPLDLPEYQAAIEEAQQKKMFEPANPKKAHYQAGGSQTSGWAGAEDQVDRVLSEARQAGFDPEPHPFDPKGEPGKYGASHAEAKGVVQEPGVPGQVDKPMCEENCRPLVKALVQENGVPQVIADPDATRVFMPDGSVHEAPGPSGEPPKATFPTEPGGQPPADFSDLTDSPPEGMKGVNGDDWAKAVAQLREQLKNSGR